MLSDGVYTLAEVSQYIGVAPTTLRSWFLLRSDKQGLGPLFQSDYARVGDDFAVSFINLVEAYVASFFKQNKVKPTDIRRTHKILKQKLRVSHPFAHADLSVGLGQIVHESRKTSRYEEVIKRQLLFPEFGDGLRRIIYNSTTKLADAWQIRDGIWVNPRAGFGKPVVHGTGVSTLIVAKQYKANRRNAALVARLFRISEDSVETAFRFEVDLGRVAA